MTLWHDDPYAAEREGLYSEAERRYGLFGKDSGGGGGQVATTNTVQKADPWNAQQPFLKYGFEQAQQQFEGDQPQFFPGQTFPSPSPQTMGALGAMEQRALAGSPIAAGGQQEYFNTLMGGNLYDNPGYSLFGPFAAGGAFPGSDMIQGAGWAGPQGAQYFEPTARGDYLDQGNPQLQAVFENLSNAITPRVQSQFALAGRSGSGAEQEAMTRQMADAFAPYAFGSYESERGRQLQAAGALQAGGETALSRMLGAGSTMGGYGLQGAGGVSNLYDTERARQMQAVAGAPQYAANDYFDIAQLGQVGGALETQRAQQIADAAQRFDFGENIDAQKLAQFMGMIQGNFGGTSTMTGTGPNPYYAPSNPWQSALGGGMLGYSAGAGGFLGDIFGGAAMPWAFGGPIGAAGGALLGGLFG